MDKHVNLLYVQNDDVGHFTWIKNLSRLVNSHTHLDVVIFDQNGSHTLEYN